MNNFKVIYKILRLLDTRKGEGVIGGAAEEDVVISCRNDDYNEE